MAVLTICWFLRGLMSVLLVAPDAASAQSIPCAERAPPPTVSAEQQLRQRTELAFTAETTFPEVVNALGEPYWSGPTREMAVYHFGSGEEPRIELWLSFEPAGDRKLTRALLRYLDRPYCMFMDTTELLNTLEVTKTRRLDQLDTSRRLTPGDVVDAWGPPDDAFGSGIYRYVYDMADGTYVQVFIYGDQARIFAAR